VRRRWLRRDADASPERAAEITNLLTDVRARGFSVSPLDDERKHLRELLALVKQDILSEDLHRLIERTSGPVARDYLWDEIRTRRQVPVSTVSSPVFDAEGRVVFGIHLQVLEPRVSASEITRYASALARTAARASDVVQASTTASPPRPPCAERYSVLAR
jgi:DNA-binding IclR family transcriptional regulator